MVSIHILVQPCLFQEGQNVIHFDVVKQIVQTIHFENLSSDERKSFTFYDIVFDISDTVVVVRISVWNNELVLYDHYIDKI